MTKPWQICLVLIVIFAAGAVSGGLVAFHIARRNAALPPPAPDVWVARDIERSARALEFTPEQRNRIQTIVKSDIEELTKLRRQSMRSTREILERMEGEIAAVLTPEQKAKYEQLLQRRRERWRQMQELRSQRGSHDHPQGPPPPPEEPPAPSQAGPSKTGT